MKKKTLIAVMGMVVLLSGCNNVPQYAPGSIANAPPGAVTQGQPTDKISQQQAP